MDDEKLDIKLNEVWRACRKIQAAVFKHGFKINMDMKKFDPHNNGLISESKFGNVLGVYKKIVGLSDHEIREVTDYFRIRDGRIAYKQFLKIICEEGQDHGKNVDIAHGLEWTDPMHVNLIPDCEKRQLCLILIKISRSTAIPLLPYFQDYELIAHNIGVVTVAHFSRVLHFMKIKLSDKDFLLLLKRYMRDSYTVNYVAFVAHIEAIKKYLRDKHLVDTTNTLADFPGKLVDLDIPELPFPSAREINKNSRTFELREKPDAVCDTIFRIQRYAHENRIRMTEFMEAFDLLNCGRITRNQFIRALDSVGISGVSRLKLSQREIENICARYADHIDRDHIRWRIFVDEIDRVFTEKHLGKQPQLHVESPLGYIKTLPKQGQKNWQAAEESIRDLCEEALVRIKTRIEQRRVYLHPFFKNFDKLNQGHVHANQAFQALLANSILVSEEEFAALADRYCNEVGFNYMKFLEDADPKEYAIPKLKDPAPLKETPPAQEPCLKKSQRTEQDVINALANAKKQATVNDIKLVDFFIGYDHHRENQILEPDFRRALDSANIKLSVPEVDIICDVFRSHYRGCTVRYRDFCKALNEIFVQGQSADEKIQTPVKHFPCVDCLSCFLNFEERTVASKALQKLARKPDQISNLQSLFRDFDKENCGTITQNQFLRSLAVRDMHNMISSHEFGVICKCFGYERGLQIEFNYREFIDILNIIYENGQIKKNF